MQDVTQLISIDSLKRDVEQISVERVAGTESHKLVQVDDDLHSFTVKGLHYFALWR
jgi:hypothetical protein